MKLLIAWLTFVVVLASANAQVPLRGPCPNVAIEKDFDLDRFMGSWHLQSSYPIVQRNHGKQGKHGIPDNQSIHVCSVIYNKLENGTIIFTRNRVGNNTLQNVSIPVKYLGNATFKLQISGQISTVSPVYSILATDYYYYAIRYICRNLGSNHEIFIDIATRSPIASYRAMRVARNKIDEKNLPLKYLTVTRSKECNGKI